MRTMIKNGIKDGPLQLGWSIIVWGRDGDGDGPLDFWWVERCGGEWCILHYVDSILVKGALVLCRR